MTKVILLRDYLSYEHEITDVVVFDKEIDEKALQKEYEELNNFDKYPDSWEWDDLMKLLDKYGEHKIISLGDNAITLCY